MKKLIIVVGVLSLITFDSCHKEQDCRDLYLLNWEELDESQVYEDGSCNYYSNQQVLDHDTITKKVIDKL